MENASKALIMAGGIMLAMITISVFYYMFSRISEFKDITSKDTSQEELLAFNKSFESYNKKLMYGSDIISVLNKALDNNKKYDVEIDDGSGYYVNVVITLKEDLQTIVETYTKKSSGRGYEKTSNRTDTVFRKDTVYSLKNEKDKIKTLLIDAVSWTDVEEGRTYDNQSSAVTEYARDGKSYTITYYPAAVFKRKTFYCDKVKYNNKTGRLEEMSFIEKK